MAAAEGLRLLLAGDVMLGRGVDQVLPHPGDPRLFEDHARSAEDYVRLAERASGAIARPLAFDAPWGAAPAALARHPVDLRLVNLETAVTRRGRPAPKGINYRMTPENLAALAAFDVDAVSLANNHVLDWGEAGLLDTLDALAGAGIAVAGAGRGRAEAEAPAVLARPDGGRLLVFAAALPSSGVPSSWAAGRDRPGVAWLEDLAPATLDAFARRVAAARRADDTVVASLHWGPNWGYEVTAEERAFAHGLIERAVVDLVHGHSSHHPRAVELHRGKPILYGAGDLLNDYEGIAGAEAYRGDLVLLYRVTLADAGHRCTAVDLLPFRVRRFTLTRPDEADLVWLERRLNRECGRFGGRVVRGGDDRFELRWG
ncbi:MAG: poly-gamma-glutamate biosynthesis protein [Alphaproteobacteria bacterium]|jgi:poly-gamma-glutamate synthesis protein (capsule biosynthesis protein)|nr:poly-gamma-glutamate biosynthesis protein [Alphaproteobacteria bacterium]